MLSLDDGREPANKQEESLKRDTYKVAEQEQVGSVEGKIEVM